MEKFNKSHLVAVLNDADKKYLKSFGENFKKIRTEKGFSQEKLELEAGVSKNQVGRIERGEANATTATLKRFSDTLKINPKEFFDF